ncbi:MAG: MBL fold metallo-hydrolase [Gemmatimonadaceae bacterium]
MRITTFTVGAFQENTYLVEDERRRRAVLVDPGDEGERILRAVRDSGSALDAIWLTHAHVDHVGGIAAIKRVLDVPICMHSDGEPLYRRAAEHGLMFGLHVEQPPRAECTMAGGETLRVGDLEFSVMLAPGHAPGHVVIHGNGVAFVGDCLFAGSIGRTDLPLANAADLVSSLEHIMSLDDDTTVYAGHGPSTTIGAERVSNPFLNGSVRIVGHS